jgi:hypothetical protein
MAAEDVARIYMVLDENDSIRNAIASGDFSTVDASRLDDYERRLLTDAAGEELPDVTGFAFQPGERLTVWAPYRHITINYATTRMTSPAMQAEFLNYQNSTGINPDG